MKIQALVAAVAIACAGGMAFAQTSGSGTAGTAGSSAGGSGTAASTPSTTTSKDASANADTGAKSGTKAKAHKAKHHATRHHRRSKKSAMADHDTDMHSMGASRSPDVDLSASDRRQRMDQAYDDWKKKNG